MTYIALGLYLSGALLVFEGLKNTLYKHSPISRIFSVVCWPVLSVVLLVAWVIK